MLYLATPSTEQVRDVMRSGLLGQMVTPNSGNLLLPDVSWALDNGCFSDRWNESRWFATLDRYADAGRCLFAVVPDVVGDSNRTDDRWHQYAHVVRERGYVPAYVTQNGCTELPHDAGAVFTGGDDSWKLGTQAQSLIAAGRKRGLWTHMGRVNSLRRLRFAMSHCYDSVDGTFLAFGPDVNLTRLLRYLRIAHEPTLFGAAS